MKRKLFRVLSLASAAFSSFASEDPNEQAVDTAAGFLTTTFALVFVLGLSVVVALIARRYLAGANDYPSIMVDKNDVIWDEGDLEWLREELGSQEEVERYMEWEGPGEFPHGNDEFD